MENSNLGLVPIAGFFPYKALSQVAKNPVSLTLV